MSIVKRSELIKTKQKTEKSKDFTILYFIPSPPLPPSFPSSSDHPMGLPPPLPPPQMKKGFCASNLRRLLTSLSPQLLCCFLFQFVFRTSSNYVRLTHHRWSGEVKRKKSYKMLLFLRVLVLSL